MSCYFSVTDRFDAYTGKIHPTESIIYTGNNHLYKQKKKIKIKKINK